MGVFGCTPDSGSFKANSEPDGFGGIKWGTRLSEVKSDMVESRSDRDPVEPGVKFKVYYTKPGDTLQMGATRLETIEYAFRKERFARVEIRASGPENFDHLKRFLFDTYGAIENPSRGIYPWNGGLTHIVLRYDEPTQTAFLTIGSTRIASQGLQDLVQTDD